MKEIFRSWNKYLLTESSLSRVLEHIEAHDCAVITAFRSDPDDTSKCVDGASSDSENVSNVSSEKEVEAVEAEKPKAGKKETLSKNKVRNRDLKATLLDKGYGVTPVVGSYVENFMEENSVEVKEDSLFVVNLKEDGDFINTIESLGRKYCQDSVLIIPQGGKDAYLLGTNNADFPGLGNKEVVGSFQAGREDQFMTRVGDRPFTMKERKEFNLETLANHSRNSRWAIKTIAKRVNKTLR